MTIVGMITDANDGISSLDPYGDLKWVIDKTNEIMDRTDTILMGRHTYEVVQSFDLPWPYAKHQCFAYGQTNLSSDVATMIHENALTHVNKLKQLQGKDIGLMGGVKLTQSLLDANLIDKLIITIFPILLGEGITLFSRLNRQRFLI
jgi:dihydrofolate reductase